jgi:hypothetical protein
VCVNIIISTLCGCADVVGRAQLDTVADETIITRPVYTRSVLLPTLGRHIDTA